MKYWKNINYNKWRKDMPDCAIRSIVAAIGIDYEAACKVLKVKYIKGRGYNDEYGIDIDLLHDAFKKFLGDIEENEGFEDDPLKSFLSATPLEDWLSKMAKEGKTGTYLVYLDDNKVADGGHIVCCRIKSASDAYFIDTFDVSKMPVQCWIKVEKVLPASSKYHYKYDKATKQFL